jgi:hypothetical protein
MSEFVTLCHCGSLEAAQQARTLLEAEGISVRLDGEHGSTIFGGLNSLLDVRVAVPPAQLEQAQRILDEFEGPQPDGDDGEGEPIEGDEKAGSEASDDGERADAQADKMPDRLPAWMRHRRKLTWWGLGIGGIVSVMYGDQYEGGVMLVLAVLVWGLTRDSDENASVEPAEVVAGGIGGDGDVDIEVD